MELFLQAFTYVIGVLYIMIGLDKNCSFKKRIISAVVVALCITFFARLFWVIENFKYFSTGIYGLEKLFEVKIGNFKIIGVLVGALVGTCILCKIFKENARSIANASVEAMFLTAGYTKVVCTIMGNCCFGKPTTLPWAISYPAINMHNMHPTALYEVIVWWSCFAFLHIFKKKIKPDSTRISFAILLYTAIRFFILEGLYKDTPFLGSIKARIIYPIIIMITLGIIAYNSYKEKQIKSKEEINNENK